MRVKIYRLYRLRTSQELKYAQQLLDFPPKLPEALGALRAEIGMDCSKSAENHEYAGTEMTNLTKKAG